MVKSCKFKRAEKFKSICKFFCSPLAAFAAAAAGTLPRASTLAVGTLAAALSSSRTSMYRKKEGFYFTTIIYGRFHCKWALQGRWGICTFCRGNFFSFPNEKYTQLVAFVAKKTIIKYLTNFSHFWAIFPKKMGKKCFLDQK